MDSLTKELGPENLPVDREGCLLVAKLAEQAERFDEMTECMFALINLLRGRTTIMDRQAHTRIINPEQDISPAEPVAVTSSATGSGEDLTNEERGLFGVAIKNSLGERRLAWREIGLVEKRETEAMSADLAALARTYRETVEHEIKSLCLMIIGINERDLLPYSSSSDAKIFYLKTLADSWRYLAEISREKEEQFVAAETASKFYEEAWSVAEINLKPSHPSRLGLALNRSVFFFDILHEGAHAVLFARRAFEAAIFDIEKEKNSLRKDDASVLILQLIRDNLTLWTTSHDASTNLFNDPRKSKP